MCDLTRKKNLAVPKNFFARTVAICVRFFSCQITKGDTKIMSFNVPNLSATLMMEVTGNGNNIRFASN